MKPRRTVSPDAAAIVQGLRRITRAIELYSKDVERTFGLTGPQLWALKILMREGPLTPNQLAEHLAVTGATEVIALRRRVKALAKENASYWRKTTREPGAENAIVAEALDRLAGLGLVRVEGIGPEAVVRPLPALRRFALAAPTIAERNAR